MTEQEAIKILKRYSSIPNEGETFDDVVAAYNKAIQALEWKEMVLNGDACLDCKNCFKPSNEYPCTFCVHNGYSDFYEYDPMPVMYYPQVEGITPTVVELADGDKAISRDEFIYGLKACGFTVKDGQTYYEEQELIKCFDDLVFSKDGEKLPLVTPQRQTGHWIAQDIHNCHTDFKCSECGYIHNFTHLYGEPTADYTYCPKCGANMFEPQERSENETTDN